MLVLSLNTLSDSISTILPLLDGAKEKYLAGDLIVALDNIRTINEHGLVLINFLYDSGYENIYNSIIAITDGTAEISNSLINLDPDFSCNVSNRLMYERLFNDMEAHLVYIRSLSNASTNLGELNEQLVEHT